jgi:hypothetical protein
MFRSRLSLFRSAPLACLLLTCHDASAQNGETIIRLGLDTASDMVRPEQMPNLTGHDDITLTLHPGGSISEQHSWGGHQLGKPSTQRSADSSGRLGGSITPMSSWHVRSSNVLERLQNFPQNTRIWRVTIAGSSCRLNVLDTLKPGYRAYSFVRSRDGTIAYFTNYKVTGTSCSIR